MHLSFNLKNNQGVALILTLLLMTLILFLSIYFLNFSMTEKEIAVSQTLGEKTYYLAEAGIAEMIWRLKNNEDYKNSFETEADWSQSFTRENIFGENSGSYVVTISNTDKAHGEIIAIGSIQVNEDKISQRIIKTNVYRAMGESGLELGDSASYADGNVTISLSEVNFYGGGAYSSNNFIVNSFSVVDVFGDLKVTNNFNESIFSDVDVSGEIYAANYPNGPAESLAMPAVDFNSEDSASYKNIADVVYSEDEFEDLIEDNDNLVLNSPITYVEGDVDLRGGINLTINGLLVIENDLDVGESCKGWFNCGYNYITVNHTESSPSGILAKRKINIDFYTGNIDIDGVVYAGDQIKISNFLSGYDFDINGEIIGRKLSISSSWSGINFHYNEEIVNSTLGASEFSPIITVEHWEEEY